MITIILYIVILFALSGIYDTTKIKNGREGKVFKKIVIFIDFFSVLNYKRNTKVVQRSI